MIYSSLAAISFWMTDASGIFMIFGLVANVLSGGIFPIDIFGKTLQLIFSYLPFQYTIYFPVNILGGRVTWDKILFGLGVQILWMGIMLVVSNLVWRFGLKKYVAVGG
jgi:ABC-2 type transport system permease protein